MTTMEPPVTADTLNVVRGRCQAWREGQGLETVATQWLHAVANVYRVRVVVMCDDLRRPAGAHDTRFAHNMLKIEPFGPRRNLPNVFIWRSLKYWPYVVR